MRPAPPLRGRAPSAPPREPRKASADDVELRLAIGRAGLGLELARSARLGCATIVELASTLPSARFPLDVSGGVARFRHRRGQLQAVALEVGARDLERWAAPRLRGILSTETPHVWALVQRDGATLGVSAREDPLVPSAPRVLAFELTVLVEGDDLVLCVSRARGTGLAAPATALAIAAVQAALGPVARRTGATFRIARASERIARALLPDAGARAPSADGMRWTGVAALADTWVLHASVIGAQHEASEDALRAREANDLMQPADDARVAGDLERARTLDLAALERAPRHGETSRRIAEIDQRAGGRAEAALATLVDASEGGLLAAELLAEAGDVEAAIAAFTRAGDSEPVPALGARAFERAAELSADPHDALELLDRALARAPATARLRWARMHGRLAAGRLEDALADVEHLEAEARGSRAKYTVWRRAGEAWSKRGFRTQAATLFERALRYAPDAPDALAGVAIALIAEGRAARGVAVLTRAIDLAARAGEPAHAHAMELARALAEKLDDLPAAIARVRDIPHEAPEAPLARGLEGRWRADLGDLAGAALAFARLRDLAGARLDAATAERADDRSADGHGVAAMLMEAATFEREERSDPFAAQRHLACALRIRPRDAELLRAYRDVGAAIAGKPTKDAPDSDDELPDSDDAAPDSRDAFRGPRPSLDLELAPPSLAPSATAEADEAIASARVDELTRRLQLDPGQDGIVDELSRLLESLGRSHELLALLSARLEDAPPERRAELLPATRIVLERLEKDARAEGRDLEARLFADALKMLLG